LGHVSHGQFQAEWAASLKGTLTFPPLVVHNEELCSFRRQA
jgi:hypothetical protein